MKDKGWTVRVQANIWFETLSQNFISNDLVLIHESDDTGIHDSARSPHVDGLLNKKNVSKRLFSLELLLNGAVRAATGQYDPHKDIKFAEFGSGISSIGNTVSGDQIDENPFVKQGVSKVSITDKHPFMKGSPAHLLEIAKSDEEFRTVLFQVGLISTSSSQDRILAWSTLYKISDSIKFLNKKYNLKMLDGPIDKQLNNFGVACNKEYILGLSARHGLAKLEKKPSSKPMIDLNEAIKFILSLVKTLVELRYL